MNDQDAFNEIVELAKEHSAPGFASTWLESVRRGIQRETSPQPFGCLKMDNGELRLATTNVPAGSSRSSQT